MWRFWNAFVYYYYLEYNTIYTLSVFAVQHNYSSDLSFTLCFWFMLYESTSVIVRFYLSRMFLSLEISEKISKPKLKQRLPHDIFLKYYEDQPNLKTREFSILSSIIIIITNRRFSVNYNYSDHIPICNICNIIITQSNVETINV